MDRTPKIIAILSKHQFLEEVADELQIDIDLYEEMVIRYIDKHVPTYEAMKEWNDKWLRRFDKPTIPDLNTGQKLRNIKLWTQNICNHLVKRNIEWIRIVPKKYITQDMILNYISMIEINSGTNSRNWLSTMFTKFIDVMHIFTPDFCKQLIGINKDLYSCLPMESRTDELNAYALSIYPDFNEYLDDLKKKGNSFGHIINGNIIQNNLYNKQNH